MSKDGRYAAMQGRKERYMSKDGRYAAMQGRKERYMSKDGRAENCSMRFLHFRHPWRSYAAMQGRTGMC